jgi:hypothetical protein
MREFATFVLIAVAFIVIIPSTASAQASIAGVVRDTSGAVLPGVTVEAANPALIEKTRSVITDGTGQYRIENLRPGAYTVTFTLQGFNTVKREGIELTGTFTATVNAELRVGALEETITVTGETPIVDVQSTTRQRVLDQETLDVLPSGKNPVFLAALIPGVTTADRDVGGILGMGRQGNVTVHGNADVRTLINGVSMHSANGVGNTGAVNMAAFQEMAIDTGAIGAEQKEGGVRMNFIPRDGGNTFRGYFFSAFANDSMQGDNFTQELKDRGLATPNSLHKFWDVNPAYGGPIKRDTVWFHSTMRYTGALNYVAMFFNKNAGDPNAWTYEPDTSRPRAATEVTWWNYNSRITWQATPKHKVAAGYDYSHECACPRTMTAQTAPEAQGAAWARLAPKRYLSADWTAPITNRLLFEAAFLKHDEYAGRPNEGYNPFLPVPGQRLSSVLEQSNNLRYRATLGATGANPGQTLSRTFQYRGVMSYITGAHALKVGFNYGTGYQDQLRIDTDSPMNFRFNNGVPNQLTLQATPYRIDTDYADHGLFVQDRWTVKRLTLTLGLRYDYFHSFFPETKNGPAPFAPTRNITFAATDGVRWHELQPRSGLVFDVFGDGKTALKVGLNRYLANQAIAGTFARELAPASRLVHSTNRSWNDANRNFVPDCNLLHPPANGECGAMSNANFGGTQLGATYDPEMLRGWGMRDFNWEVSAGVQRELVPRMSMDVSYFRRWFGNFIVTDDRAVAPSDFDRFSITAPPHPRLPGGGGYVISGLYNVNPAKFGVPAENFLTFADNYGKQIRHWNGVDVTVNARPRAGVMLGGGTSTGRTVSDNCEILAKVPEVSPVGGHNCHVEEPFLTQVKFFGTYTVPRFDVQVTAALQNMPGPAISANYNAPNTEVAPSLGRNLAGGARNVTIDLVQAGTMYGERMNQIDVRIGKILTVGRARATASLDVYNILNASPVLAESGAFGTWLRPLQILNARFAKVVVQLDF